jgi:hypothetical protein
MKTVKVKITGTSPLSFSKYVNELKLEKENPADYDERTWRERMHYDSNGQVFVPPMMFKNALSAAAKYRGEQIVGKGKSNYTKHFEAGIFINEPMPLGVNKDDVKKESILVPADGRRGGTTRVLKHFPKIENWTGVVTCYILDEIITKDVFERHLQDAGNFIGIGRFRPRNNGYYGRFSAEIVSWE